MTTLDPAAPSTTDLLDRLLAGAETTRREPDRILAALGAARCPECAWPLETDETGVSCGHCE